MTERPDKHAANMPEGDDELSLSDILAQVAARKWLLVTLATLGVLIGAAVGQLGSDEYRADALVQIEKRASGVPLPEELIGNLLSADQDRGSTFETEIHVIRSRLVLSPVVRRLDADARVIPVRVPVIGNLVARRSLPGVTGLLPDAYQRPGESLELDSMTVSDARLGTPFTLRVTGPQSFVVSGPTLSAADGRVGEHVEIGRQARLRVSRISALRGRTCTSFYQFNSQPSRFRRMCRRR